MELGGPEDIYESDLYQSNRNRRLHLSILCLSLGSLATVSSAVKWVGIKNQIVEVLDNNILKQELEGLLQKFQYAFAWSLFFSTISLGFFLYCLRNSMESGDSVENLW